MTPNDLLRALGAVALVSFTLGAAAAPHPFGIADWQALRSTTAVAAAPDGRTSGTAAPALGEDGIAPTLSLSSVSNRAASRAPTPGARVRLA